MLFSHAAQKMGLPNGASMKLPLLLLTVVRAALHVPPPLPTGWSTTTAPVEDSAPLELVFSIVEDVAALEAHARAVSDPSSPLYGSYLSASEVAAVAAPEPGDVAAIARWLVDGGVDAEDLRVRGNRLAASTTISVAATLFSTDFAMSLSGVFF